MADLFPTVLSTPTFVLDVSVPLRWLVVAQGNLYTSGVLSRMSSNTVAVPASWPSYFARKVRAEEIAGHVTEARADRFLSNLRAFSIAVDSPVNEQVWHTAFVIARTHRLDVEEGALLELALRLSLPIATDELWLSAAATALGIPIFQP
jgi:predicted nucleic acid-binding protein